MRIGWFGGLCLVCFFASYVGASPDAALGNYVPLHATSPYFSLWADHEQSFNVGDVFRMQVYGAGGRSIYAARVTVFYNEVPMYSSETDVNGLFAYSPPLEGKYEYTIHDSRYPGVGGEFWVVNRTLDNWSGSIFVA
jgi:hypothetical protein